MIIEYYVLHGYNQYLVLHFNLTNNCFEKLSLYKKVKENKNSFVDEYDCVETYSFEEGLEKINGTFFSPNKEKCNCHLIKNSNSNIESYQINCKNI